MALLVHQNDFERLDTAAASTDVDLLNRVLGGLGTDCDKIAFNLWDNGFRGVRGTPDECPLANYLSHVLGGSVLVSVDEIQWSAPQRTTRVATPYPVVAFIGRFDAGHYHYLAEPKAKVPA